MLAWGVPNFSHRGILREVSPDATDGIDTSHEMGIAAVVQPGGSIRDQEVIDAADEHGMTMLFTGTRLFRH